MATNSQSPTRSNRLRSPIISNPFYSFLRNDFMDLWNDSIADTVPSINIRENNENYLVEMAAPGLKKEDFNVQMDNNLLTISCEKESENMEGDQRSDNYWQREHNSSCFSRSITLPDNADNEHISARYTNGILNLAIPKKAGTGRMGGQKIDVE